MQNLTDQTKDLLLTRSLLLQRVSNSLTKDIINAYVSVIDDILAQIATGKNINLINMNKIIKELNAKLTPDLTSVNDDLVQLGISEASYVANGINGAIGIDLVSKLPTDRTVQKIVNTSLMDGLTISEWLGKQDKSFQETLTKQIRLAVIEGETNPQIVSRLKGALDIKNNNNIKTIVRTAVATVTSQVREQTYKDNEDILKGWEWNATLDSRTRKADAIYDGSWWDFNGKGLNDKGKANKYKKPPSGWNCRCIMLPIVKSFKELGIPLDEVTKGTRSSIDAINGKVSRDTTFEKWFEGKPKTFQEEYLGKGRYELYKKGTITFSDLVNQNGRTLKISELTKINPIAKVSNIPTIDFGYGGKFNKYVADIRDEANLIIRAAPKPRSIILGKEGYYQTKEGILSTTDRRTTFIHEYGHHIDNDYGGMWSSKNAESLYNLRMKDAEALGLYVRESREAFLDKFAKDFIKFDKEGFPLVKETGEFSALSDMIDSATMGYAHKYKNFIGHGTRYYSNNRILQANEDFANMFALWSQDTKGWAKAKEYFPSLTKEFEKKIKDFIEYAKDDLEDE